MGTWQSIIFTLLGLLLLKIVSSGLTVPPEWVFLAGTGLTITFLFFSKIFWKKSKESASLESLSKSQSKREVDSLYRETEDINLVARKKPSTKPRLRLIKK